MIRETRKDDWPVVETIYTSAFPDEDLLPLLRALRDAQDDVTSFVFVSDPAVGTDTGEVVGHVCLTTCHTLPPSHNPVALLGPLAVAPVAQKQGIGRALIAHSCQAMARAGIPHMCVLGDPGYYQRHGFLQETGVQPPYPLPQAWATAWQGRRLADGAAPGGQLVVPAPWQDPALWG